MEGQCKDSLTSTPRVKATLRLGVESFSVHTGAGILSEQLAAMKEESMTILKDFITKNNIPNDIPDEPVESISEDESETVDNPPKKSKEAKITSPFFHLQDYV